MMLPSAAQRVLTDLALTTGVGRHYLDLALRTLEAFGADRFVLADLVTGVHRLDELGPAASALAAQLVERGERALAVGHHITGFELLRQATLIYAIADRLASPDVKAANFACLVAAADRTRGLDPIPTRRVRIAGCPAYFRAPPSSAATGGGVVLVQGTNTSKDMFFTVEQAMLARGLAVLNIDQPGTGECLLLGRRMREISELQPIAAGIWEFLALQHEPEVHHVGVFGFSLGGMVAPALCALDHRFKACAMVATGLRVDATTLEQTPSQLKARALDVAGVATWADARALAQRALDLTALAQSVRCPVRAFHGARDSILPVAGARALFAALGSTDKHLTVVPDGDHTCSRELRTRVLPELLDWLADTLREAVP
jgi:alpha-beta hydrolase superfamily lysophospholipase